MTGHDDDDELVTAAAVNNAAWCAAVCRTHGIDTHSDPRRWWSPRRTPLYYPDAVSLDSDATPAGMLEGIDISAGCSVKDSFDALDLTGHGFRELFRAKWIHAPAATFDRASRALPRGWRAEVVRDDDGLRQWTDTWGDGGRDLFRAGLLRDGDVRLGLVFSDSTIAGIVALNRSAGAVGISNVVCARQPTLSVWQVVGTLAATEFPGCALVGYERDEDLEAACSAGFVPLASLRVWMR